MGRQEVTPPKPGSQGCSGPVKVELWCGWVSACGLAQEGATRQAPSCRVRPRLSSRRRLRAAVRVCSQALFLTVPR